MFSLDRAGATAIEYALIVAFISIVIVTAVTQVGGKVTTIFNSIAPFV
jgi:pilus assembly protein Flp/PilA